MKIKNTPRLLCSLLKMQARLKGLILRNRIRTVRSSNRINQGKDTSNYTYSASTKIVLSKLIPDRRAIKRIVP